MDIRSLISKLESIEAVNEALTLDQVTDAVGQEKSEQKRAQILMTMAQKENLPGLYDPVSGYFVSAMPDRDPMTQQEKPRISATASKGSDKVLADMGLVPQNASTSTFLGRMFRGDQKGEYDADTKKRSSDVRQQQFISGLISKATPLLDKLEKKYAQTQKESVTYLSGIAKALAESVGYELSELVSPEVAKAQAASNTPAAPGADDEDLQALQNIMMQLSDINDPQVKVVQDRYAKLLSDIDAFKKAADKQAADKKDSTSQAATPAPVDDELKKEKMKQARDLLNKFKKAVFDRNQNDPLLKDKATAGALPKSMSESEIIANLRQKLESYDQPLTEAEIIAKIEKRLATADVNPLTEAEIAEIGGLLRGLGTAAKAGWSGLKNIGQNFASGLKGGKTVQPLVKQPKGGAIAGKIAPGGRTANKVGKAIAANPVKTSVATGLGGAALGYGLADKGEEPTQQDVTPAPRPSPSPSPAPTDKPEEKPVDQTTTPTADDNIAAMRTQLDAYKTGELAVLADDPEVAQLIKDIQTALDNEQTTNKYSLNYVKDKKPTLSAT